LCLIPFVASSASPYPKINLLQSTLKIFSSTCFSTVFAVFFGHRGLQFRMAFYFLAGGKRVSQLVSPHGIRHLAVFGDRLFGLVRKRRIRG